MVLLQCRNEKENLIFYLIRRAEALDSVLFRESNCRFGLIHLVCNGSTTCNVLFYIKMFYIVCYNF